MEFLGALYSLFLMPIQLVLEELYALCFSVTGNPATAVLLLSLVMCAPALPLLGSAQRASQRGAQDEHRLTKILSALAPTAVLTACFVASDVFLSSMQMLQGVPFGPISNLAASDGLLGLGTATINIAPIAAGALGVVASVLANKGATRLAKSLELVAALAIAAALYLSPAAASLYWGIFCVAWILAEAAKRLLPQRDNAGRKRVRAGKLKKLLDTKPSFPLLLASGMFLVVLVGCFVPATSILPSAELFAQGTAAANPIIYLASSSCIAAGVFVIWPAFTHLTLNERGRIALNIIMVVLCVVAAISCASFCDSLIGIDQAMALESDPDLEPLEITVNVVCIIAAAVLITLLYKHLRMALAIYLPTATAVLLILFAQNAMEINASYQSALASTSSSQQEKTPSFTLSKTGKNVIVIMVDRGMSVYVPYIMNERPELKESFDGFTYYPNTVSYSGKTIVGSSCFYGGYEYTPENNFKRDNMTNVEKQNESLLMMPVMFSNAGYKTTVFDPTFANYGWTPDLSIFDDYPNITAKNVRGSFPTPEKDQQVATANLRNTFCYGLMRCAPVCLRPVLYYGGTYNCTDSLLKAEFQTTSDDNVLVAYGQRPAFVEAIRTLQEMCAMTHVSSENQNTFLMMSCDSAHDIATLQEPSYTSEPVVDNTAYEAEHANRLTVDGVTINMDTQVQVSHYQANMATFIQLAEWLDYLKAEGVYDNTRIIIGADHGFTTGAIDGRTIQVKDPVENTGYYDIEHYHPLLMVKDFGSTGFITDETFMTHADVPTLTTQGAIENPTNPFTGKAIAATEEDKKVVNVFSTYAWAPWWHNGNTYNEKDGHWFSVHDDVRDPANWKEIENPVTSGKKSGSSK